MDFRCEPNAAGTPVATAPAPLAGLRVLDFSHYLAGPFCTRLFADLGAEVVRVESRTRPDRMGATRPRPDAARRQDRPAYYLNSNRNKQSIAINLKHAAGRALAVRLAGVADVIVENFSGGVMERLGLDYPMLAPSNPRLVYISMSGYGHSGPRCDWTSMNMNLQAYTGLMAVTGGKNGLPTTIANSWNDYIGGFHAAFAVMEALRERTTSGRGRYLDLAQFECSVATLAPLLLAGAVNRGTPPPSGDDTAGVFPQGIYRCAGVDEWCAISVQDNAQLQALLSIIGRSGRAQSWKLDFGSEIEREIEAWTTGLPKEEVERRLSAAGVPAAAMQRIPEVLQTEAAARVFPSLEDVPFAPIRTTALPVKFSRSALPAPNPAPRVGEHTDATLRAWLGMSTAQIAALQDAGGLE